MLKDKIDIILIQVRSLMGKKPLLKNVLVLVSGTTLAQILAVAASPFLTRLYAPEEFGLLTVYSAILALFATLATMQYEYAIPLPEEDESAASLLVLSFLSLVAICLVSGTGLWVSRKLLADILHIPDLSAFLWLIPFSLLGLGTYNILNRWSIRRKTFGRIARSKVTQSVGMVCTSITLGLLKQGVIGLLLGDMIGKMGGSSRLVYLALKEEGPLLGKVTRKSVEQVILRYRKFPLFSTGPAFVRELSEQLPALFLSMVYGPGVVGLFMLVQKVLGMPLSLVGYSVGSVYMAEASRHMQKNDNIKVLQLYWQTVKHLLLIAVPVLTILSLTAQIIFPVIFGPEWSEAGVYLRILCPMYLLQFLSIPLTTTLYVFERQDLQLIREGIRMGLLFLSMFIITTVGLSPVYAFSLLSAAGSLSFLVYGFVSWLAIKQGIQVENLAA